jgi:uncharacterized membrane protein required for colicin V production
VNPVDLFLLLCIAVPAALGLWRGMVGQLALVAGLVGAGAAAFVLGGEVAAWLLPEGPAWAPAAGAALAFFGVFIAIQIVGWGLRRLVAAMGLKWADHLGGGVAAAAAGGIAGAWCVTALALYLPERPAVYADSSLVTYAEQVACVTGLQCASLADDDEPADDAELARAAGDGTQVAVELAEAERAPSL